MERIEKHDDGTSTLYLKEEYIESLENTYHNDTFDELVYISNKGYEQQFQNLEILVGDASYRIVKILMQGELTLSDINRKLRELNLYIWPFLVKIGPNHVHQCVSIKDFKDNKIIRCDYAVYIFIGSQQAFIAKELIPFGRSYDEHLKLLLNENPGLLTPKD